MNRKPLNGEFSCTECGNRGVTGGAKAVDWAPAGLRLRLGIAHRMEKDGNAGGALNPCVVNVALYNSPESKCAASRLHEPVDSFRLPVAAVVHGNSAMRHFILLL